MVAKGFMAPTKKPRTMKNKRFSSEVSTKKDEVGSSKNKQRVSVFGLVVEIGKEHILE